jgi:CDP-glucose 4,6-dehydratase
VGSMALGDLAVVFSGRRVLITGDTGFKGSWLSMTLREAGADIVGYALPPRSIDDHYCLLGLEKLIHHVDGDIRDYVAFKRVINEFQPEFVFHLAAQALVRLSYAEPKETMDTNVGGSVNILEAIRHCESVRTLIFVTSDKCYLNREWVWGYRENDELGGHDPYSSSKAAAEFAFSTYMESFFASRSGFGAATVRAGNVIGGGDWADDRIVPDCIRSLREDRDIVLRSPGAIRPWQHVLEPLSGYLLLAARLDAKPKPYSGAWNFGPYGTDIRTVNSLAEKIIEYWGSGKLEIIQPEHKLHEARLLHLNCDKSHQLIGWEPRWNFDQTVSETVHWYREILQGTPAADVTRRQIVKYFSAAHSQSH